MGQTYQGAQDGYGKNIYETIPSNYFNKTTGVFRGTATQTYWMDADYSTSSKPTFIPYRNLGFWFGTRSWKGNNTYPWRKLFLGIAAGAHGIIFDNAKLSITNQATLRQRLLTQGQTSTTTWDFESSQNLIIATGDRMHYDHTYTEDAVSPPFVEATLSFMPDFEDQDLLTYEELAVSHTKHFTFPTPRPQHGKYWDPTMTDANMIEHLLPGRTGTKFLRYDGERLPTESNTYGTQEYTPFVNRPVLVIGPPQIPSENGLMKFKYRLRIQTSIDYILIMPPYTNSQSPPKRELLHLPAVQIVKKDNAFAGYKDFYPGFSMTGLD